MAYGPRFGAAAIIVAMMVVTSLLPVRYRIAPDWLPYADSIVMLVAMAIAALYKGSRLWRKVERVTLFAGVAVVFAFNTSNLLIVVYNLVTNAREMSPTPLFYTSLAIWAGNMFIFTLVYWLVDSGGPDARASGEQRYVDFSFPAMDDPDKVPPNWFPGIVDYLFLGFTTSTAFSPTEAMPYSARAKLLVIVQSSISLLTIAVVAARTVNILR
ncbi:MAG: hypothetical protein WA814_06460 [Candidatus Baltobacteraceae bacterium]